MVRPYPDLRGPQPRSRAAQANRVGGYIEETTFHRETEFAALKSPDHRILCQEDCIRSENRLNHEGDQPIGLVVVDAVIAPRHPQLPNAEEFN
jgi:hypothetical protein